MGAPRAPKEGDRIQVSSLHRFHGEYGTIIAIGDNPLAKTNHFHIQFDREVPGTIQNRELWLGMLDFAVIETDPA